MSATDEICRDTVEGRKREDPDRDRLAVMFDGDKWNAGQMRALTSGASSGNDSLSAELVRKSP